MRFVNHPIRLYVTTAVNPSTCTGRPFAATRRVMVPQEKGASAAITIGFGRVLGRQVWACALSIYRPVQIQNDDILFYFLIKTRVVPLYIILYIIRYIIRYIIIDPSSSSYSRRCSQHAFPSHASSDNTPPPIAS